jgi:hypothetical protein
MSKNLILGLSYNYTVKNVYFFVESFKNKCSSCDLCLITEPDINKTLYHYLKKNNVIVFKDDHLRKNNITPVNHRYLAYKKFLNQFQKKYQNIFLTDVRDVVFLDDIFKFKTNLKLLNIFFESIKFAHHSVHSNNFNFLSIEYFYGIQNAFSFLNKMVSCCGNVLGSYDSILNYIELMVKEINSFETSLSHVPIADTAVHNFLVHVKYKDNEIVKNYNGVGVATLQETNLKDIVIEDNKVYVHTNIPHVLHQYDRHTNLYNFIKTQYPYEKFSGNS